MASPAHSAHFLSPLDRLVAGHLCSVRVRWTDDLDTQLSTRRFMSPHQLASVVVYNRLVVTPSDVRSDCDSRASCVTCVPIPR